MELSAGSRKYDLLPLHVFCPWLSADDSACKSENSRFRMSTNNLFIMDQSSLIKKKICLLGCFAVGKTSLVERFVHNRFDDKYLTTIGVKVSQKILPPVRNPRSGRLTQFNFLIWDIERVERFDAVIMNYYRGAAGALAVADLTRSETISGVQEMVDKFCSVSPAAQLLVLGNKLDIFQEDKKSLTLLSKTASSFSTEYLLTSAKTGELVEAAFLKLAERIGMAADG